MAAFGVWEVFKTFTGIINILLHLFQQGVRVICLNVDECNEMKVHTQSCSMYTYSISYA